MRGGFSCSSCSGRPGASVYCVRFHYARSESGRRVSGLEVGETPGEEIAIYYVAVIEIAPKWEKNNEGQVDFKAMLDEKLKTGGIGFRGTLHSSSLVADISKLTLGNEKKTRVGR